MSDIYMHIGSEHSLGTSHVHMIYLTMFGKVETRLTLDDCPCPACIAEYMRHMFSGGMDPGVWHQAFISCADEEVREAIAEVLTDGEDDYNIHMAAPGTDVNILVTMSLRSRDHVMLN